MLVLVGALAASLAWAWEPNADLPAVVVRAPVVHAEGCAWRDGRHAETRWCGYARRSWGPLERRRERAERARRMEGADWR
jgi:hypothetical protein